VDQLVVDRTQTAREETGKKTKRLAMVASKGTLDMAYPPLILATTAAAMGWEVGIFFTFYGLDLLHRRRVKQLKVSPWETRPCPLPYGPCPSRCPTSWELSRACPPWPPPS
jgi:peroxiredoxin family protein